MTYLTYKYRIKDSVSRKRLCRLASTVNFVWNYINQVNKESYKNYKQGGKGSFLSAFELNNLLSGSSKELNLHSQSIQSIAEKYVDNRKTFKKSYLKWRSYKRNLGWIPFKSAGIKIKDDAIIFGKEIYRIYKSRSIPETAKIKCGSFNQDSQGRWFISITFEVENTSFVHPYKEIGIDLGIKDAITLSDGQKYQRPDLIKRYAKKLARAQRAKKKKQVSKIHDKIKNVRNDHYHKLTTEIAKQFAFIYIGDVSSQAIIDKGLKNITKGVYDASWYKIKEQLEDKAKKLGGSFKEVNERYTTQDCASCSARCGPKGLAGLSKREWQCSKCGALHNRDVNSARNILRIGHDTLYKESKD